jgi:hypothetical protein
VLGHAWFPIPVDSYIAPWGVPLWLACQRCGAERHDLIGRAGQLLTRTYHYQPGYLYDPGEKVPRDDARGQMMADLGVDVTKGTDRPPVVLRRPVQQPTPARQHQPQQPARRPRHPRKALA